MRAFRKMVRKTDNAIVTPDSNRCKTCRHFTQERGTYGVCGPFTWNKDRLPWWVPLPRRQLENQLYVHPDEGAGCAAWEAGNG